jgi:hypothetical protein
MTIVRLVEYAEAAPELRRTWENVKQVMTPGALDPLVK